MLVRRAIPTLILAASAAVVSLAGEQPATAAEKPRAPNIVFVLADDLGYGDLGCYGATRIKTPNCDRLAREGLRFTDAHSPSAVCTPTRYAFMTGEYAWRKKGTGILPGTAGLIVEPGRVTVAALLKQAGYTTGVVGKWHLGLGTTPTDYNGEIKPGPLEIGFDYAWLLPGHRRPHAVRLGREPSRRRPRPGRPDQARLHRPARRTALLRQRHPAHRRTDRRQGGALEGRRDRRRDRRQGRRLHREAPGASRSSSTSPRTTSTCRACRTRVSAAPARPACAATRSTRSTGPSARS